MLKDMIMKKTFLFAAITALLLAGCRPEPYEEIGPDYSLTEGMTGTWVLHSVTQTDQTQPVPESVDISDFFQSDPMVLSFNYETRRYTVDNAGAGLSFFGDGGTFVFDDPDFPEQLYMNTDDGKTYSMTLTQMVRSIDNRMGFIIDLNRCDEPNISYNLDFNRQ